jgi:hypothetical protein
VARFKRLTDAEARTLTRAELLDRVEAEQAYWARKRGRSDEDVAAEMEFSLIMHTYLSPQGALDAVRDVLEGRESDYWDTRPGAGPGAGKAQAAEWDCEAYGPEPARIGALCFRSGALGKRVCNDPGECHTAMTAERQRVYRRINELAAHGDDPTWTDLAEAFGRPGQLLGGEDDEPPGTTKSGGQDNEPPR